MVIKLYHTNSANNVVKKNIELLGEYNCEVKEDYFSIINPIIIMSKSALKNANYARIEEYGRYYFIKDIQLLFSDRVALILDSDDICNADFTNVKGLCTRNELVGLSYQMDSMLPLESSVTTDVIEFPNGFSNNLQYVLTVLGG